MPDFAVVTRFTVQESLTKFFSKGEIGAKKFDTMVSAAFSHSGKQASLFKSIFGGVTLGNLASNGIRRAASEVRQLATESIESAKSASALRTAFGSVFGAEAATQMKFASTEANRLGLAVMDTSRSYMSIAAAAKGTALSGKPVQEIFLGVAEAATALKLTTDQSNGALLALQQMISKGKVSAEEMRQQLGERLPGALQIAARAMNMNTMQFDKLMSTGKLMSAEFLPKFAAQMRKEFGAGADAASKDFGAIQQRFENVKETMRQGVGGAILPALSRVYDKLTPLVERFTSWLTVNQGIIASRIFSYIERMAIGFERALPTMIWLIQTVKQIGPPILAGVIAFNLLRGACIAAAFAGKVFGLVNTILFAFQAYAGGAATAQEALNLVMAANPVGLVVTAVAVLVGLFTLLASKVGGIGPAFLVVGQTVMKALLAPVNLVIDAWQFLISLMAKIPGLGKQFSAINSTIDSYQAKMNAALTGSEGSYNFAQPYQDARATALAKEAAKTESEKARFGIYDSIAGGGIESIPRIAPTREAPNQALVQRQESIFSGRLDIVGAPQGSRLSSSSTGPSQIRVDLLGANP